MKQPSERHKLTSDNNIIKFKKPVHDPFKKGTKGGGTHEHMTNINNLTKQTGMTEVMCPHKTQEARQKRRAPTRVIFTNKDQQARNNLT